MTATYWIRRAGDAQSPALAVLRTGIDLAMALALAGVFLLTFVMRPFYIPSNSMAPALQVRDMLLVSELDYRIRAPRPGDVAIFVPPVHAGGTEFVKRVIGIPGDAIRISGGIVYRNGAAVRESYVLDPAKYELEIQHYTIYVNGAPLDPGSANIPPRSRWQHANRIPSGCYLMLGDNRNQSDDSHVWGFAQNSGRFFSGPLSHAFIDAAFTGRAFLVFWPPGRLHVLR